MKDEPYKNKTGPLKGIDLASRARRCPIVVLNFILLVVALLWNCTAVQAKDEDVFDMDLEQLMKVKVSTASIKERPLREQAGIVSVLTEDEIRSLGVDHLMDLLDQVPGYSVANDTYGGIGLQFRGLWAHEGKSLLIIDGIPMNEPLYGTAPLAFRIPTEIIRQVEIIRGPGSARYGGNAELTVIRVTTKGSEMKGGFLSNTLTYDSGKIADSHSLGYGDQKGNWRYGINASIERTFWSTRDFVDQTGARYSIRHASDATPESVSFNVGYRDLDVRLIYDNVPYEQQYGAGTLVPSQQESQFETLALKATYDWKVHPWLTITPRIEHSLNHAWQVKSAEGNDLSTVYSDVAAMEAKADISDTSKLLVGTELNRQFAKTRERSVYGQDALTHFDGKSSVTYDLWSVYSQFEQETPWVNFTVGGRYEHHDRIGGSFVPRLGITKSWERWHAKLLYSQSYRTPNIEVIATALGEDVKAEDTRGYEMEVGRQFTDHLSWTCNLYYMQIRNALIYQQDPMNLGNFGYLNERRLSTYGAETELRLKLSQWQGRLSYANYVVDQNTSLTYQSGDVNRFLGAPTHKISSSISWNPVEPLTWSVNGTLSSRRRAFVESTGSTDLPVQFLLNTLVEYRWKQVRFGLGVHNLLDEPHWFIQPYQGGFAPLPGRGREYFLRVRWEF